MYVLAGLMAALMSTAGPHSLCTFMCIVQGHRLQYILGFFFIQLLIGFLTKFLFMGGGEGRYESFLCGPPTKTQMLRVLTLFLYFGKEATDWTPYWHNFLKKLIK